MDNFGLIGNTHVGNIHPENQDRITKRKLDSQLASQEVYIIGVADGISQCSFGASVTDWIIEKHLAVDTIFKVARSDGGKIVCLPKKVGSCDWIVRKGYLKN